ncbi:LGFP repeat-containing protein [Streptomyces sp. SP17KL33]|uniref:LGFP repeat-containing protein n=1 Tax=Streptomyces sp. SP17KL33 TaxID=3002534 RepID=UPI002E76D786|nr:hypothetical protein [Streptomyces sp. SP17KL33]MEE1830148.1 hypothetical protein [Streptomyces sp. SP17KL33]
MMGEQPFGPIIDIAKRYWEFAINARIEQLENDLPGTQVARAWETESLGKGWRCRRADYYRKSPDGRVLRWTSAEVHWTAETGALFISGGIADLHRTMRFLGPPAQEAQFIEQPLGKSVPWVAFSKGRIYDSVYGAHALYGDILQKWLELETGPPGSGPGYPRTSELGLLDGRGRYNHFSRGSIYWTPTTGAYWVSDKCRDWWVFRGGEASYLGYPVSDASDDGVAEFERGSIRLSNGAILGEYPHRRVVKSGTVHTPDGYPVNGWSELTIFSNGAYQYRGSIHCSGAPSYNVSMAMAPRFVGGSNDTRTWVEYGDVEGSLVLGGNLDHRWDSGLVRDQWIEDNWDRLNSCDYAIILRVGFGPEDFLKVVGTILGIPFAIIGMVVAAAFLGEHGPKHVDICGGYDENGNPKVIVVPKGEQCPDDTHK